MPRITNDEYRTRLERLQVEVAKAELDLFLVTSFDSIYYLTGSGLRTAGAAVLPGRLPSRVQRPTLLVPRLDAEHMEKAVERHRRGDPDLLGVSRARRPEVDRRAAGR